MTVKLLHFVKLLYQLGVIRRFVNIKKGLYRIFPNWHTDLGTAHNIRFFRNKRPIHVKYKALSVIQTYTFNSTLILHTDKGLLTHKEALKNKIGGQLICTIN